MQSLVLLISVLGTLAHADAGFTRSDYDACMKKYEDGLKFRYSYVLQGYCGRFSDEKLDLAVTLVQTNGLTPSQAISVIEGGDMAVTRCLVTKIRRELPSGSTHGNQEIDDDIQKLGKECVDQRAAAVDAGLHNLDPNATYVAGKVNQRYFIKAVAKWLSHQDENTVHDLRIERRQGCFLPGTLCVYQWIEDYAAQSSMREPGQDAILYDVSFKVGNRRLECVGSDYVKDHIFGLHLCLVDGQANGLAAAFGPLDYTFQDLLSDDFKRTMIAVKSTGGGEGVNRFEPHSSEYVLMGYADTKE